MDLLYENETIGTIFTSSDHSPNVQEFLFIVDEEAPKLKVKQGMYCYTASEEGMLIGKIEEIFVSNEYYNNPQTVKNFDQGAVFGIKNYFPSDKWEDCIGHVKILGLFPFIDDFTIQSSKPQFENTIKRPAFPAKPGNKVYILEGDQLKDFLGLDELGLTIGSLEHYNIDVRINLNKLINKHFAVLAMSGAGKSYLISVLMEELLLREKNLGTPGVLLIDVHGEYKFLSDQSIPENKHFAMKTSYYDAKYFQIDTSTLKAFDFANYQPNITNPQIRELKKVIENVSTKKTENNEKISYDLDDLIENLEEQDINQKVKETLGSWLYDLRRLNIFGKSDNPVLRKLIIPGHLSILDLSNIISIKKKQIIVSYLAEKLFYLRRMGVTPPFLFILEEAHQFAPEGKLGESSISKPIIETISREGRKFYAQICLISQRPVKLSTTALSQCNTHIILRVTNPNDLDHIKNSSEAINKETMGMISTLPTGNAMIMGAATNLPLFVKIRKRFSSNPYGEEKLDDECRKFMDFSS